MVFRVGQGPSSDDDKSPQVLQGPTEQVTSRQLRPRAVRMMHLAPDVRDAIEGVVGGSNTNGRFWRIGDLLVCTHRLTGLASGTETWTYPADFSAIPRVNATPHSNLARTASVIASLGSAEIRAWDDAGAAANVDVEVVAIGPAA